MWAAWEGKADCAEALLEWGADKDAANNNGDTALHYAAFNVLVHGLKYWSLAPPDTEAAAVMTHQHSHPKVIPSSSNGVACRI